MRVRGAAGLSVEQGSSASCARKFPSFLSGDHLETSIAGNVYLNFVCRTGLVGAEMAVKALTKPVRHLLQLPAAVPVAVMHVPIIDEAIVAAMITQRYDQRMDKHMHKSNRLE